MDLHTAMGEEKEEEEEEDMEHSHRSVGHPHTAVGGMVHVLLLPLPLLPDHHTAVQGMDSALPRPLLVLGEGMLGAMTWQAARLPMGLLPPRPHTVTLAHHLPLPRHSTEALHHLTEILPFQGEIPLMEAPVMDTAALLPPD